MFATCQTFHGEESPKDLQGNTRHFLSTKTLMRKEKYVEPLDTWFGRVDHAMYQANAAGRNVVCAN